MLASLDPQSLSTLLAQSLDFLKRHGLTAKQIAHNIGVSEAVLSKAKDYKSYQLDSVGTFSLGEFVQKLWDTYHLACPNPDAEFPIVAFSLDRPVDRNGFLPTDFFAYYYNDKHESIAVGLLALDNAWEKARLTLVYGDRQLSHFQGTSRRFGPNAVVHFANKEGIVHSQLVLYCGLIPAEHLQQLLGTYSGFRLVDGTPLAGALGLQRLSPALPGLADGTWALDTEKPSALWEKRLLGKRVTVPNTLLFD